MVIAILADEVLKKEISAKYTSDETKIIWADSMRSLEIIEAEAYFDLLFENDPERIAVLKRLLPKPVFINSVIDTLADIRQPFIRINGWPTMMIRETSELAIREEEQAVEIEKVFGGLKWKFQVVPDIIGMITPKMIAILVNEALFMLNAASSSKEEMLKIIKLASNDLFNPFEWSEKIGHAKITALLEALHKMDSRYSITPFLINQV